MVCFGQAVVDFINLVLLFLVYAIGVGVTSVISKLFGKKFLDVKYKRKKSYWNDIKDVSEKNTSKDKEEYYNQY